MKIKSNGARWAAHRRAVSEWLSAINASASKPMAHGPISAAPRAKKVQSLSTVRGRIGAAFDQILLYGTGGVAFADNKISGSVPGVTVSDTKIHTGWAAGVGLEWMFTRAWSLKTEYLYRRFDSQTYFTTQLPPGIASGTLAMNSIQVGINYHF